VAIPKFVDLSTEARNAAIQGVAGGISSASAVNYAAKSANSAKGATTANLTCSAAAAAILEGGIPNGYAVTGPTLGAAGTTSVSCTVNSSPTAGTAATASIIPI
jgi:MSHA pilin protein MshA